MAKNIKKTVEVYCDNKCSVCSRFITALNGSSQDATLILANMNTNWHFMVKIARFLVLHNSLVVAYIVSVDIHSKTARFIPRAPPWRIQKLSLQLSPVFIKCLSKDQHFSYTKNNQDTKILIVLISHVILIFKYYYRHSIVSYIQ